MPRITITLSEEIYQALKEAATRQRRPMNVIIEESLRMRGIKSRRQAQALVARARQSANLSEEDALTLATGETRKLRHR